MAVDPGITLYLNVNLSGKFHDSRDPACIFFFEVWLVTEDKWKQESNGISLKALLKWFVCFRVLKFGFQGNGPWDIYQCPQCRSHTSLTDTSINRSSRKNQCEFDFQ